MCGRFALGLPSKDVAEYFQLDTFPVFLPRYNIAPSQPVAGITIREGSQKPEMKMFRWGLIPSWAKDPKIGCKLINARSETVHEKPSFKSAFKSRRSLIPSTGFYEWKRTGAINQPYYFRMADNAPFAFAGLWESWRDPEGAAIESCTILTTAANDTVLSVHNRMPVIMTPEKYDTWLDSSQTDMNELRLLLQPYAPDEMTGYATLQLVNNPRNEDPQCIFPANVS